MTRDRDQKLTPEQRQRIIDEIQLSMLLIRKAEIEQELKNLEARRKEFEV